MHSIRIFQKEIKSTLKNHKNKKNPKNPKNQKNQKTHWSGLKKKLGFFPTLREGVQDQDRPRPPLHQAHGPEALLLCRVREGVSLLGRYDEQIEEN